MWCPLFSHVCRPAWRSYLGTQIHFRRLLCDEKTLGCSLGDLDLVVNGGHQDMLVYVFTLPDELPDLSFIVKGAYIYQK
jgi:hypothetical protein